MEVYFEPFVVITMQTYNPLNCKGGSNLCQQKTRWSSPCPSEVALLPDSPSPRAAALGPSRSTAQQVWSTAPHLGGTQFSGITGHRGVSETTPPGSYQTGLGRAAFYRFQGKEKETDAAAGNDDSRERSLF